MSLPSSASFRRPRLAPLLGTLGVALGHVRDKLRAADAAGCSSEVRVAEVPTASFSEPSPASVPTVAPGKGKRLFSNPETERWKLAGGRNVDPSGSASEEAGVACGCGRCCTFGCRRLTAPLHSFCCVLCSKPLGERHALDCDVASGAVAPPAVPRRVLDPILARLIRAVAPMNSDGTYDASDEELVELHRIYRGWRVEDEAAASTPAPSPVPAPAPTPASTPAPLGTRTSAVTHCSTNASDGPWR